MTQARQRGNDPDATAKIVAANLRTIRQMRGLTLRDMQDRLTAYGRPIPYSTIGKAENVMRRIDVDDLMAFAAVLEVSPLNLLLPDGVQLRSYGEDHAV